jgi:hypothetical protein
MADEQTPPAPDEAPGWQVLDPDGNVVQSGQISQAQAAAWINELLAEAARNEGDK